LIKPVLSGAEDEVRSAVEGTADWILDLGPEGGVRGGEIVAEGTPEQVAANARSFTGAYLKPMLAKASVQAAPPKPTRARAREAAE